MLNFNIPQRGVPPSHASIPTPKPLDQLILTAPAASVAPKPVPAEDCLISTLLAGEDSPMPTLVPLSKIWEFPRECVSVNLEM